MEKKKPTEQDEIRDENAQNEAPEASGPAPVSDEQQALQALRNLTADDDGEVDSRSKVTLASILGGDILGGRWFRKHFWYMVMIVAMLIVYVSNRYSCQHEQILTKVLSDTLIDRRYKALTRSSQLKERMRRSYIEESLEDTTLQTAVTPSFYLRVDE